MHTAREKILGCKIFILLAVIAPGIMVFLFACLFVLTDWPFERCVLIAGIAGSITVPAYMLRLGFRWRALAGFFVPVVLYFILTCVVLQGHFASKSARYESAAIAACMAYHTAQENHFAKHQTYALSMTELARSLPPGMSDAELKLGNHGRFRGYVFRIIPHQKHAETPVTPYLFATPFDYDVTGRNTFAIVSDGKVLQCDLGIESKKLMEEFTIDRLNINPPVWVEVE